MFRNCVSLLSVLHLEEEIELKLKTQFKFKPKAAEFIKVRLRYFERKLFLHCKYFNQITNHTTSDDVIQGFINQMNIQEPRETFHLYEK